MEIIEDRHGLKSIIITSQLPVESWYDAIGDPTVADAILDRIVHTAHKIELTGDSVRKINAKKKGSVVILGGLIFVNFPLCIHLC